MSNFNPLDLKCRINMKPGWHCRRHSHRAGPCALIPKWWNWSKSARQYRKRRHL